MMFDNLYFMVTLVLVLFATWLGLKFVIRRRRESAEQIRGLNVAGYVLFLNNFKKAEAAEQRGRKKEAIWLFKRALASLEQMENPDALLLETIVEVRERIARLEGSSPEDRDNSTPR